MANGIINMSPKKSVIDHTQLINRNLPNQHPISAISGLQSHLDNNAKLINIKLDSATQELKNTATSIQNSLTDHFSDLRATVDIAVDQMYSTIDNQQAQLQTLSGNISEVQTELKADLDQLQSEVDIQFNLSTQVNNDIQNIKNTLGLDMEPDVDPDNPGGSSLLDRVTQLENFVGGTGEGATVASQIAALSAYIDSLHPLVLTVTTANQIKHFTESKNYTISWKTNRSLPTNKMYITVGTAEPQEVTGVSTSTAEVNYTAKITVAAASSVPPTGGSSTDVIISELENRTGLNKTIKITDTHYIYSGMSNIEIGALTETNIKTLSSTLQTTANRNETTYSGATSAEPKYLYYIVPAAYTQNKKLVCKFSQGISEFEAASKTIDLTYNGTSVEYAIYKITSDKQIGSVTMAVSVESKL